MSRSTNAESGWLVYPLLLWPVGADSSFGFWTKKELDQMLTLSKSLVLEWFHILPSS